MVVRQNNSAGMMIYRGFADESHIDYGAGDPPFTQMNFFDHLVRAVQKQDPKFLVRLVTQVLLQNLIRLSTGCDLSLFVGIFFLTAATQLKSSGDGEGFDGAHPT